MCQMTHVGKDGSAKMVDVSNKEVTRRNAVAKGRITCRPETMRQIREMNSPKGNPLETSRIAGIMAAKETGRLIPLCHPLPLEHIDIILSLVDDGIEIVATVTTSAKTGAEMEALTAVSITALTLYDMLKAVDKKMIIEAIRLEFKSGGKSGTFERRSSE